ncbi:MAG: WD40 repeat domain-containing protein, partial [Chloroflexota bacterium]
NPDGNEFAYITWDGNAVVWNVQNGEVALSFTPQQLSDQGQFGAGPLVYKRMPISGSFHDIAWGWKNAENGNIRWMQTSCDIYNWRAIVCPETISLDGKYVAMHDEDGTIIVRDAISYGVLYRVEDNSGGSIVFSPDGKYILSLRYMEWVIDVWDTSTREKIAEIDLGGERSPHPPQEFSFTADGDKLVTDFNVVKVWNTKTWQMERSFDALGRVSYAAISGDGSLIVARAWSGYAIYLWHLDQ